MLLCSLFSPWVFNYNLHFNFVTGSREKWLCQRMPGYRFRQQANSMAQQDWQGGVWGRWSSAMERWWGRSWRWPNSGCLEIRVLGNTYACLLPQMLQLILRSEGSIPTQFDLLVGHFYCIYSNPWPTMKSFGSSSFQSNHLWFSLNDKCIINYWVGKVPEFIKGLDWICAVEGSGDGEEGPTHSGGSYSWWRGWYPPFPPHQTPGQACCKSTLEAMWGIFFYTDSNRFII